MKYFRPTFPKNFISNAICSSLILASLTCHLPTDAYAADAPQTVKKDSSSVTSGVSSQDYGTIFIVEQKNRPISNWRVSLNTSYEFSNPYTDVFGFSQSIERSVGRYVRLGAQLSEFVVKDTFLMNVLRDELKSQRYTLRTQAPLLAASGIATLVPLSGHFAFFGDQPLEAELAVRLGVGGISYRNESLRLLTSWSIRPSFHLNKRWSVQMGFGQDIESVFSNLDRMARFKGDIGLSYGF